MDPFIFFRLYAEYEQFWFDQWMQAMDLSVEAFCGHLRAHQGHYLPLREALQGKSIYRRVHK